MTEESIKYYQIGEIDNRLNESKLTIDSIPKIRETRRSFSFDKLRKHKFYDLITMDVYKSKFYQDARIERRHFLKHLEKLQIAHQKQLDTVKHIVLDTADQIVTKKIVGFQQSINKEIKKILEYIKLLKTLLNKQKEDNLKICRLVQKYELTAIENTIK